MRYLLKLYKKYKLLRKYKLTDEKMLNDIHLHKLLYDNKDTLLYLRHIRYCELRCYNRLKKLK